MNQLGAVEHTFTPTEVTQGEEVSTALTRCSPLETVKIPKISKRLEDKHFPFFNFFYRKPVSLKRFECGLENLWLYFRSFPSNTNGLTKHVFLCWLSEGKHRICCQVWWKCQPSLVGTKYCQHLSSSARIKYDLLINCFLSGLVIGHVKSRCAFLLFTQQLMQ